MKVSYSYLSQQFADPDPYFQDLRELVASAEFTLGPYVEGFERKFTSYVGARYAIGTNTGTDALILALKGAGVQPGDEVITVPNTFVATVGAIIAAGARPAFVDCDDRFQIDVNRVEAALTPRTRAILPVHWAGCPADVVQVQDLARRRDLLVIEDACPALGAQISAKQVGTFGRAGAFSFHPLKPLNVWGDGGMVVTNDEKVAKFLRLYRNHGLSDRDHVEFWGVNNRLQPIQAVVASRLLDRIEQETEMRIRCARRLDAGLADLAEFVTVPQRPAAYREVYQLYQVQVQHRQALIQYLAERGVESRIHYPLPLHLQRAARSLGYQRGAFPVCEKQAEEILTLPCHPYLTDQQVDYVLELIHEFYRHGPPAGSAS